MRVIAQAVLLFFNMSDNQSNRHIVKCSYYCIIDEVGLGQSAPDKMAPYQNACLRRRSPGRLRNRAI